MRQNDPRDAMNDQGRKAGGSLSRRRLLQVSAGAAAALALGACASPPTAGGPIASASGAAAPSPRKGGVLTLDVAPDRLSQLDLIRFTYEERVANLVTERLIVRDFDMNLVPALATAWKLEGDTWTMTLRQGVKFHDGTPFNADALLANFVRWSDPAGTHSARGNLTSWGATMQVVDPYTVRIKMRTGHAVLPAALGGHGWLIMSPKALESLKGDPNALNTKPVGTGPFKMQSMIPAESITMVRNDEYWDGAPYLDSVVIKSIAEAGARTAALLTGDVDIGINLPAAQVTALRAQSGGVTVEIQKSISQVMLKLNTKSQALSTAAARQAVAYATNRNELKDLAYGGFIEPFDGPVNPLVFKADASAGNFNLDPAKARQLLETAGPAAKNMEFIYTASPEMGRVAQLLQQQFAAVGITLKVTQVESASATERRATGNFDITNTAHSNSYGDAALFLNTELRGGGDQGKWARPESDALIDKAMAEADPAKRAAVLNDFWKLFYSDPGHISVGGGVIAFAKRTRVQGFRPHPNQYLTSLAKTWLSS